MPLSHTDPASDTAGLIEVVVRQTRGRSDSGENVFFTSDGEETEALVGEFVGWWAAALAGKAPETPGAPCVGLADRLKRGTEAAHAEAENVAFVQLLLGGKAPLEGYVCLVAALRRIYGALEAAAGGDATTSGSSAADSTVGVTAGAIAGATTGATGESDAASPSPSPAPSAAGAAASETATADVTYSAS